MKLKFIYALLVILSGIQLQTFAQGAGPGTAGSYLDINNVKFFILNGGDWGWNLVSNTLNEMPKGSKTSTIFAGGLWIGGYDHGNLHIAAMTYRQNGEDFFPGPLDIRTAGTDSSVSQNYNKIWGVHKNDIDSFRNGTKRASYGIKSWPGEPLPNTGGWTFASTLAPFVDVDSDGYYTLDTLHPKSSDYPKIKGDQAIWWVMNDNGNYHGETHGLPLGFEIRSMVYGYNCTADTALNNTVFFEYQIINRSFNTYDSLYIGNFTDFDIGDGFDDYNGTDTSLSAFYGYNGEPHDSLYKNNPPAQAVVFLDAPLNNTMYYNNDFTSTGNPGKAIDYYHLLQSVWLDSTHLVNDGKTGHGSGTSCNYVFPGYPDSAGTKSWTEKNAGNVPADRRMLGSSGPYSMKPGAIKTITFAYVFTQLPNGNYLSNVAQMRKDVAHIRNIYNAGITTTCSTTGIDDAKIPGEDFKVFPNPALDGFSVEIEKEGHYTIRLMNVLGQTIFVKNVEGSQRNDFSLQGVPPGVYSLILSSGDAVGVKKLIVK